MMALKVITFLLLSSLRPAYSASSISFEHSGFNFSSSAPHIFASAYGLLQQWPNSFFPFGHSIVPCEVPVNTPLYHARMDGDLPGSPEWFAFDPDMSYAIAGLLETSHLLTYKTTRKVQCIYFDGASASLKHTGNMDTQMVFIHNNSAAVPDEPLMGPGRPSRNRTSGDPNGIFLGAEYDRADALCSFIKDKGLGGKGWGYEGIVRMNAAFEMIWCDFDSPSIRLVYNLDSSNPILERKDDTLVPMEDGIGLQRSQHAILAAPPPGRRFEYTFLNSAQLGWLTATSHRYGLSGSTAGRGEIRVRPDSCGIFNFYDPKLEGQERARISEEQKVFNLTTDGLWVGPKNTTERFGALQELTRRRTSHRVMNVSTTDGIYMREAVETRLRTFLDHEPDACSGIDWLQTMQEIVLTYSTNLHDFLELLQKGAGDEDLRRWLKPRREMAHMMIVPYYEYPSEAQIRESPSKAFSIDSEQAMATLQRCQEQATPENLDHLGESERMIHTATRDVLGSICRTTLKVFLSIENLWFVMVLSGAESSISATSGTEKARSEWKEEVEELMAWLGWADQWTSCKPGCGIGQICYIPIWPLVNFGIPELNRDEGNNRQGREGPPQGPGHGGPGGPRGPGGPGYGRPGGPGYGRPGGPGSGYGYGPPHGGRDGPPGWGRYDSMLWEPRCLNRTQLLG